MIHVGLERECEQFVNQVRALASRPTKHEPYQEENGISVEGPWHKLYIKIFRTVHKFDKHIADRYDHIGGSRYLLAVAGLYIDGWLTDDEVARLEEAPLERIKALKSMYDNE